MNYRKYHNKKVIHEGVTFDSTKELNRYLILRQAEEDGIITDLKLQPEFSLLPNQYEERIKQLKTKSKTVMRIVERAVDYRADFSYKIGDKFVVEDVKISKKLIPKEYILKRKMMLYFHGIKVRQVFDAKDKIIDE